MKIKLNTGLIATNGDGKPTFLPPIPSGWCRPLPPSLPENTHTTIKFNKILKTDSNMSAEAGATPEGQNGDDSASQLQEISFQNSSSGCTDSTVSSGEEPTSTSIQNVEKSNEPSDGSKVKPALSDQQSEPPTNSNTSYYSAPTLSSIESSTGPLPSANAIGTLEVPAETSVVVEKNDASLTENEDSNVDVETEEQLNPLGNSISEVESNSAALGTQHESSCPLEKGNVKELTQNPVASPGKPDDGNTSNSESENTEPKLQDEEAALSDAQYIEKQVVDSFLHQGMSSNTSQTNTAESAERQMEKHNGTSVPPIPLSVNSPLAMSDTAVTDSGVGDTTPSSSSGCDSGISTQPPDKVMDALSMTIASVAAGEGEPPEYISKYVPDLTKAKTVSPHRNSQSSNRHKKSRADKSMSASARLPVISSLLAPTSVASHQSNVLPGIQHIAPSSCSSNSPNTVLPSVAHFLGPAKSPPSGFTQQQQQQHPNAAEMLPSMGPEADLSQYQHSAVGNGTHPTVTGTPNLSSSKTNKANRKPVTPAGLRLSMAASEELPDPLPVPQYSDKVIRAKQLGTVAFDRPTVLRETVQFFLQYKHYWSSHDYDRISNLVIELFPEFKDSSDTPGVPANKRIRTDLSMYARNFRRREVSQRKKEGGSTPTAPVENKSDPSAGSAEAGPSPGDTKSFLNAQPSPSQPPLAQLPVGGTPSANAATVAAAAAGSGANPTDFCNELLTAASIIESQNTSSANRNGECSQLLHNQHKLKVSEREPGMLTTSGTHLKHSGLQKEASAAMVTDGSAGPSDGYHTQQRGLGSNEQEQAESQPIHFVYDKDSVPAAASRDANAAWQMYSDQMAQAMTVGTSGLDYGVAEEVNTTTTTSSTTAVGNSIASAVAATDRLSAMAMWRSTTLPDPLPTPHYSDSVTRARESGNTMSARPKIIRETTQFFLALKLWWTAPDYERIAELVLKNFPALVSLQAVKKDLGTCARNMRRRLPSAKYKPSSSQVQKTWGSGGTSAGVGNAAVVGGDNGMEAAQQGVDGGNAGIQAGPTEYMKALLAAQSMNLSELGMSQRNLGELAVLAGIKQRIEQHPAEAGDLERQYLAQCTTEEQRQALIASGAFGSDNTAMAALSAFYGQLGVDISSATKRGSDYTPTSLSNVGVGGHEGVGAGLGELLVVPNKRQRRISQAEVEKRLREAELNHVTQQGQHHSHLHHHHQQLQQQQHSMEVAPKPSHQGDLGVSVSNKHLVKREPTSPTGMEGLKNKQQQQQQHQHNHHLQQQQHQQQQHHHHQQLTVPSPINMVNNIGSAQLPPSSTAVASEQAYWDVQGATNMALMGLTTSVSPLMATQAHSQSQIQHLSSHSHPGLSSSHTASHEVPMNLTYHEADKTDSPSSQSSHPHHRQVTESPTVADSLPDTAGLAAQVEVTTSSTKSPRRRTSSSPRSGSHQGDASLSQRDQVWFPHGQGFKKENQEVVCLPEPLPVPMYSQKIAAAREDGTSMRHRSEIIRETARFFLGLKYWWSSADYTRISELVVQQFPDLKDDSTGDGMNNYRRIQRDLSMCARNLRRSKKPRKMRELSSSDLSMMLSGENSSQHSQGASTGESRKRLSRPKGAMYGAAAERKAKRQAGVSSARTKKAKAQQQALEQATALEASSLSAVSAPVGSETNEDMTAAAALMQQQFMQQPPVSSVSSVYHSQHPSAHLLPTAHLLPSLHTHPSLHEQHLQQMNTSLLHQQEGTSITVEEAHSAKRLVKEEPAGPDLIDHTHSGIKANMVNPVQRTLSPALGLEADGQATATAELAKQRVLREMEGGVINREEAEKLSQAQVQQASSTMKVYVDPDHGSDLQERFSTLWRKGKFFDASLGVANKKLHVHKLVLLAMSPYLQETFKNADPRSQLEVNLPSDTTYETAKAFLKYIYEGILEVDTSSVRSLHKIAFMLQMNKLAQYCQNFAQQLQEEAEQALQRLGETNTMTDLQRATARYVTEEHMQFKAGYLAEAHQADSGIAQPHFLHQDALTQHRALVTAASPTSSHQHQQQQHHQQTIGTSSALLLSSSGSSTSAQDLATQHLIQAALVRHQAGSPTSSAVPASSSVYQQQQQQQQEALATVGAVPASDANSGLLQRLTSPALAAYWQAHTLELMSKGSVTSDPSNQTSASELAAIAAAATSSSSSSLTSEDHRHLGKGGGRGSGIHSSHHHQHQHHQHQQQHQQHHHHHKERQQWVQHTDPDSGHHHGSMLPETCLPGDLGRGNS